MKHAVRRMSILKGVMALFSNHVGILVCKTGRLSGPNTIWACCTTLKQNIWSIRIILYSDIGEVKGKNSKGFCQKIQRNYENPDRNAVEMHMIQYPTYVQCTCSHSNVRHLGDPDCHIPHFFNCLMLECYTMLDCKRILYVFIPQLHSHIFLNTARHLDQTQPIWFEISQGNRQKTFITSD